MRSVLVFIGLAALAGCATTSPKSTIEARLHDFGLSRGQSACAADHLDSRLNDRELREFARFTNEIRDPETPREVFASLERISDRDIAAAVAAAGVRCALVR